MEKVPVGRVNEEKKLSDFFRSKKVGRKIFGVKNSLGRKFCLTKFYSGLIRFVFDLLLITAELNNNNTEFLWWWVVGGSIPIM